MRCKLITSAAAVLLGLTFFSAPVKAAAHRPLPRFIDGVDLSLLTAMEAQGVVYKVDGKPVDLMTVLRSHGWNCVRLRLWVDPSGKGVMVNDLPYTIALAKRAKRAGLMVMLDIHYSDTWADPGKQFKPAAWASMPFDELTRKVHNYTRDVVASMRAAGAMPDIVATGNEIVGGMLWPDGKDWGPGHDFRNLSTLLKSAGGGVRDGAGGAPAPLIMIHIDKGADWKGTQWFFDGIGAYGVDYDIIGESYYPQLHGPLSRVRETLTNAAVRYHKPIVIVETAYPRSSNSEPISEGLTFPETPDGQLQFLRALDAVVHATPNGLGRGIVYWEPEWLGTKGLGGAWNTTALFDDAGNALPAFDAFRQ